MQPSTRSTTNPLAMREYGIVFAFIGLCIFVGVLCQLKVVQGAWPQNAFLTFNNLMLILHQISVNGILAVGMTFVVISGGIDLSVGSVLAFSGMMAASFATRSTGVTAWAGTYGMIVPLIVALVVGSACGALNGWIVSRFKIQAFIATLGMLMAARGFTMAVTDGNPISALSPDFRWFGTGKLFDALPMPAVILGLVFLVAWILLNKTVFGRYVYAVGGNEKSARTSGINTKAILIWVYVLSGLLAGLAGVILTAKTGSAQTAAGTSYELDAIAAVVIGGASLSGGIGRLTGTFFGALIIGVMNNGLDILGVESFYQLIIKGSLIVFAVILDPSRRLTA
ncbi:ABC transporter permease [Consotaella aegiceratis]|uniref:ABC transporter permease n=1 Tax=Consotaella aegiceratis TaxID=3097961 RepID=UPI002F418447